MDVSAFAHGGEEVAFSLEIPKGSVVCIVDSSFNPPNRAHAKLAHLCRRTFPDCYVIFMLATGNADKPTVPTNELQSRSDMMAILAQSEFANDSKVGMALTTKARFFEKGTVVNSRLPHCKFAFAMGFDTLARIVDQKYYTEPLSSILPQFFDAAELIVLTRNEDKVSKTPSILAEASQQQLITKPGTPLEPFTHKLHFYEASSDTDQVSSSRARQSVKELRRCTPGAIASFVESHNLYGL